jgi:hypothetical protein
MIFLALPYLVAHPSKWVITPVVYGISRVNPLITGVITHLLSGMSHQVLSIARISPFTTGQARARWDQPTTTALRRPQVTRKKLGNPGAPLEDSQTSLWIQFEALEILPGPKDSSYSFLQI